MAGRALIAVGSVMALLFGAALFVAYVWEPSPTAYDSPYLRQIDSR